MLHHLGTIPLKTDRLIMRPFEYTDSDDMLRYWISDEAVQSMYAEPVYTTSEEVKPLLEQYINGCQNEDYYRWAIIEESSKICIGQIALFFVSTANECCEIEYCLGRDFHRRGYMTEAMERMLVFCYDEVGFHRVQISHRHNNIASKGVIDKCGFIYEGTFRDYLLIDGQRYSRVYYSLLRDEWNSRSVNSSK